MHAIETRTTTCPDWCVSHETIDGAFEHNGPAITLTDFPDAEARDATIPVELRVVQWESFDPASRTVSREVEQVRIAWGKSVLYVNEQDAARRLGEVLLRCADMMTG